MKLNNYTAQGFNEETGKLSWVIKGKQAFVVGDKYNLHDIVLTFLRNFDEQHITSKFCQYDILKKISSSKEQIVFQGNGFKVEGKGFDIDHQQRTVYIRSQVKVVWKLK